MSGSVLATFTGAVPAASTWYAFEFEVVISATTGSFAVRKNGNNVNDFSATALNTQGSANAYANKLTFGMNQATSQLRSTISSGARGASSGTWLGDIRCYTRMPVSDQSVQFSKSPPTSSAAAAPTGPWRRDDERE